MAVNESIEGTAVTKKRRKEIGCPEIEEYAAPERKWAVSPKVWLVDKKIKIQAY